MPQADILEAIAQERIRQDQKFGVQDHPNGTGSTADQELSEFRKSLCNSRFKRGVGTWRDVLYEEVAEAFAERNLNRLQEELVQVTAVAVAWCEAIERQRIARKRMIRADQPSTQMGLKYE